MYYCAGNERGGLGYLVPLCCVIMLLAAGLASAAEMAPVSAATEECLFCHRSTHPGIVADWERSRHARVTPVQALKKDAQARRISVEKAPEAIGDVAVGCAECHTANPDSHGDTFEHQGRQVHVLVTPRDCSQCHAREVSEFEENLMSWAHVNLRNNTVYQGLIRDVNGIHTIAEGGLSTTSPDAMTDADSCFHCHGTAVERTGTVTRDTPMGEMDFPVLSNWPNQGVGRINPDGSRGACSACHSRHQFSIVMARKPYTCSQCHKGPDVPAYAVYAVSKHGNLFSAMHREWNFDPVPWTVGKDFTAPTCAVCHVSLVVDENEEVIAERTHRMNDRLPWRILGLPYAHHHPKDANTTVIKNSDGMQLPTTLAGEPATEYLIGPDEVAERRKRLQHVCAACHSSRWIAGHWERFENTIETTNRLTLTSTQLLQKAWEQGLADSTASFFDEAIERDWVEEWLFFANSTRFASAMMGADYGVFANGRWYLSKNIKEMVDRMKFLLDNRSSGANPFVPETGKQPQ